MPRHLLQRTHTEQSPPRNNARTGEAGPGILALAAGNPALVHEYQPVGSGWQEHHGVDEDSRRVDMAPVVGTRQGVLDRLVALADEATELGDGPVLKAINVIVRAGNIVMGSTVSGGHDGVPKSQRVTVSLEFPQAQGVTVDGLAQRKTPMRRGVIGESPSPLPVGSTVAAAQVSTSRSFTYGGKPRRHIAPLDVIPPFGGDSQSEIAAGEDRLSASALNHILGGIAAAGATQLEPFYPVDQRDRLAV